MEHALRLHAKYNASAAYRWMVCPGSVALVARAPRLPPDRWQQDGTDAHELLDYALKNRFRDAREASIMADRIAKDTHPDAGERIDAVQQALDFVWDLLDAHDDAIMYVEHKFKFPSDVAPNDAYGTCDVAIHIPSLALLYVIDYKHGMQLVEVDENKQALYYGTGAVLGSGGMEADTIALVIIQPRAFHPRGRIRTAFVTRERLEQFVYDVDIAIMAAMVPNAPLIPGNHCGYCEAKVICPARERMALKVVDNMVASFKDITKAQLSEPVDLSLERLILIKQHAKDMRAFLDDVEEALYLYAMQGNEVPGYKLVEAQARRKWHGDPKQIADNLMALMQTPFLDDVYPRQLITITEAQAQIKTALKNQPGRKVTAKDATEEAKIALATLTLKESSGKITLVEASDPRPPIDRSAAAVGQITVVPPSSPSVGE